MGIVQCPLPEGDVPEVVTNALTLQRSEGVVDICEIPLRDALHGDERLFALSACAGAQHRCQLITELEAVEIVLAGTGKASHLDLPVQPLPHAAQRCGGCRSAPNRRKRGKSLRLKGQTAQWLGSRGPLLA